jgi:hypothetical protein
MTGQHSEHDPRKSAEQHPDQASKSQQQKEQELEKALEDTFPASDPPATSSPTRTVGWEEPPAEDNKA